MWLAVGSVALVVVCGSTTTGGAGWRRRCWSASWPARARARPGRRRQTSTAPPAGSASGLVQLQPSELAKLAAAVFVRRPARPPRRRGRRLARDPACRSLVVFGVVAAAAHGPAEPRHHAHPRRRSSRDALRAPASPLVPLAAWRRRRRVLATGLALAPLPPRPLLGFLDPWADSADTGYQTIQSLSASPRAASPARPGREPGQVGLPARRPHRLHLRHHRRGARPDRRPPRGRACSWRSASSAPAPPCAPPTASACCSPPASPRGSSSRRSSTSARCSASCRSPACRCRSSRFGGSSLVVTMVGAGLLLNVARQAQLPDAAAGPARRAATRSREATARDLRHRRRRRHGRPPPARAGGRRGARRPRARRGVDPLRRVPSAGIEATARAAPGFPMTLLPGRGIQRRLTLANLARRRRPRRAAFGRALGLVRRLRPRVVVAVGGYASVAVRVGGRPAGGSRWWSPSRTQVPGAANRLAGPLRQGVRRAVPGHRPAPAVVTGNPVRPEVLAIDRARDRPPPSAPRRRDPASPGARLRRLARRAPHQRAVLARCPSVARPRDLAVHHVVGRRDWDAIAGRVPADRRRRSCYRRSSTRTTCRRALGRRRPGGVPGAAPAPASSSPPPACPAILVPSPVATADHQTRQRRALVDAGAAVSCPTPSSTATGSSPRSTPCSPTGPAGRDGRAPPAAGPRPTPPPASPPSSRSTPVADAPASTSAPPRRSTSRRRRRRHERHRHRPGRHGPRGQRARPQGRHPASSRSGRWGCAVDRRHAAVRLPDGVDAVVDLDRHPARQPGGRRRREPRRPGAAPGRGAGRHLRHAPHGGGGRHPRQDDDVGDARHVLAGAGGAPGVHRRRRRHRDRPRRGVGRRRARWSSRPTRATAPSSSSAPARRRHQRRGRPPRALGRRGGAAGRLRALRRPPLDGPGRPVRSTTRARPRLAATRRRAVTYGTAAGADYRDRGRRDRAAPACGSRSHHGGEAVAVDGARPRRAPTTPATPPARWPLAHELGVAAPTPRRPRWRASAGVARRFEPRGEAAGVMLVDDYAHLPDRGGRGRSAAARAGRWGGSCAVPAPPLQPHRGAGPDFADALRRRRPAGRHRRLPGRRGARPGSRASSSSTRCSTPTRGGTSPGSRRSTTSSATSAAGSARATSASRWAPATSPTVPDQVLAAARRRGAVSARTPIDDRGRDALGDRAPSATCPSGRSPPTGSAARRRCSCEVDDEATSRPVGEAVRGQRASRCSWSARARNLLVADAGFPGLAVVLGEALRRDRHRRAPTVEAGAAALRCRSWPAGPRPPGSPASSGPSGVPGSVGGAVRMNAGGHGSDMAACLVGVRVVDLRTRGGWMGARRRPRPRLPPLGGRARTSSSLAAELGARAGRLGPRQRRARRDRGLAARQPARRPQRRLGVHQPARRLGRPADRRGRAARACGSARRRCPPSTPTSSRPTRAAGPTTSAP